MFANSWAIIAGIMAMALPFVIHWLTKPRPTRVSVSTLKFIRGAVAQRRSRYRLRDIIILCLRTAAILLFAFAIARPLLNTTQRQTTTEKADVTRIVLLDCSQSMAARDGGIIRFERAKSVVNDLLKYEAGLKCNLLLASANSNAVFDSPTTNLSALKQALADSRVRSERLKVQNALNQIGEMFASAGESSRLELIVVSDFQRSNWATADFSVLPESCDAQLRSVASEDVVANLAVVDFKVIGPLEARREADIAVTVGNYSDTPRDVQLEVSVGDVVVSMGGLCAAQSETAITSRLPVQAEGWYTGSVRLVSAEDNLAADDQRPVALKVLPNPRVALLSRDSSEKPSTAAWYIHQALLATLSSTDADGLIHLDSADPDLERLKTADITIIVRPGRLSSETLSVLKASLQRGKAVLYVVADQLDAVNLTDMKSAFGSALRMPVDYLPRPAERAGVQRLLTSVNQQATPFNVFGDDLPAAIGSLEFTGGLISRPNTDGLAEDIRGTLDDQSAFLSISAAGRGRFAVLNADLQRSNLAKTPVLVPLLGEIIAKELASSDAVQNRFSSGETFTMTVDAGEEFLEELQVVGPDNAVLDNPGRFQVAPAGILWDVPINSPSGVLTVKAMNKVVAAATAEIPAEESDLRTLSASVFEGRLSGGRNLTFQGTSVNQQETLDTTWIWLAVACMGCLILELFTLKLFRS